MPSRVPRAGFLGDDQRQMSDEAAEPASKAGRQHARLSAAWGKN